MSEAKQILETIINDFSAEKLSRFFREKSRQFVTREESYARYNDDDFKNGIKLGEINFPDNDSLLICAFEAKKELSERTGKKAQYDKTKAILKATENQIYSASIFIFYDANGNFRFSLVYPESIGVRRQWNNFRRFTYFVSSDPQITNKTFKQRIGDGDFSSLEKIKDAFSVEKVTKEFYQDIANWYFWAIEHCQFPKDAEAEENGRNIAVIRLITRIIFIWFMRERGLMPKNLFEGKNIQEILKDTSLESSTYYHAILQNLFFATLSTKKDERKFRSEIRGRKGYNPDFGNQNVFRFQKFFKNADKLKDYFSEIPFLNGGLFECLDDKPNGIYIDGFTAVKKNQPNVPNFLFFSKEKNADLNTAYGTKNKNYKVRGLLDILSSFNFTIDENSPDDQDIALDPELLGRVFENLLASFNPETSTTARKATGSYYTPREIVDYMVAESLKAYFKTHLQEVKNIDEKLENLFSIGSDENPLSNSESKKLVELIESVRIVDPAVGSGAFPMGALNKMVFILNKVDPENELWKQAQLSVANIIPDQNLKVKTKREIENYFQTKKPDYWRKLYLIQKCIYGVDIQPIAVEIAKLRFFISLLVDEDKDDIQPLPNLDFKIMQGNSLLEEYEGIKLFNEKLLADNIFNKQKQIELIKEKQSKLQKEYLDLHAKNKLTTIKQAELNEELKKLSKQLKGLNRQDNKIEEAAGLFDAQNEAKQKREMLKRLHKEFFETNEKETKNKIKKQIEKIGWDLIEATLKEQNKTLELKKLEKFKKSNTKPFFLWKLHFADVFEKGGFDIVIANPPYIDSEGMVKSGQKDIRNVIQKSYLFTKGNWDIYIAFFELAFNIINKNGMLSFITPDKWISKPFGDILRKNTIGNIFMIVRAGREIFEGSKVDSIISFLSKKNTRKIKILDFKDRIFTLKRKFDKNLLYEPYTLDWLFSDFMDFLIKIDLLTEKFSKFGICENACATSDAYKIQPLIINLNKDFDKTNPLKIINTGTIGKYYSKWGKREMTYLGKKYLKPVVSKDEFLKLFNNSYGQKSILPKIILKGLNLLDACLDGDGITIPGKSTLIITGNLNNLKFLLSIINSKFVYFYIKEKYISSSYNQGIGFTKEMINNLPIPKISDKEEKSFIELVDKILAITKSDDYLQNEVKKEKVKEYEQKIDQLVYKLYGLTPEEIKIIENHGAKNN